MKGDIPKWHHLLAVWNGPAHSITTFQGHQPQGEAWNSPKITSILQTTGISSPESNVSFNGMYSLIVSLFAFYPTLSALK